MSFDKPMSCDCQENQDLEHFHYPKNPLCPFLVTLSHPLWPLATIDPFFSFFPIVVPFPKSGIIQWVDF